jgi:NAD+ diphosphatase
MPFVHQHAPHAKPAASDSCLVIQGDRILARVNGPDAIVFPEYGAIGQTMTFAAPPLHVGLVDGRRAWLCGVEGQDAPPPADWEWQDTRGLLALFTPAQSHAISCARQLLWWEGRHRFCGACGTATVDVVEERARKCPKCGAVFFPVVSPAVIVLVTRDDELLLAHNRNFKPGMFSLLAGFVDPGETLEQAVVREVFEETRIQISDLTYVTSQPWSYPNSLMLGFRARYVAGDIVVDGKEIEQAGWYKAGALPDLPRPGSVARSLIDTWVARQSKAG